MCLAADGCCGPTSLGIQYSFVEKGGEGDPPRVKWKKVFFVELSGEGGGFPFPPLFHKKIPDPKLSGLSLGLLLSRVYPR
jgi:hypothetical protein